jgi:hypothetical protein
MSERQTNRTDNAENMGDAGVTRQMGMADRIIAHDTRDDSRSVLWSRLESELSKLSPVWDAVFTFNDSHGLARLEGLVKALKHKDDTKQR